MNNRVYVCGGSDERLTIVQPIIDALKNHGVDITHDWTRCEGYDRPSSIAERRVWAKEDLAGVQFADIVWGLAPAEKSEGFSVELGAAIVQEKIVIVSGQHAAWDSRIFALLAVQFPRHSDAFDAVLRYAKG